MTAIVVVGPPGSGDGVVVDALASAPELRLVERTKPPFPETITGTSDVSHRLTARDARRGVSRAVRAQLGDGRPLVSGLRLALRVPFLDALLPDARFVLVHRDPPAMLGAALDAWRSGSAISAPDLPGWPGPPWSLPLVDGWRELAGLELPEVVARQWAAITETLLSDLEVLSPERWCAVDRAALLDDPSGELRRLCAFLDVRFDQGLATPVEAARRRRAASEGPQTVSMPDAAQALAADAVARLADVVAEQPAARARWARREPLASRSPRQFAAILEREAVSLVTTSTEAGKVVCVRQRDGRVNTDFADADEPGAVAAAPGRLALATRTELWDLRADGDVYSVRTRHVRDAAGVGDMALAGDELLVSPTGLAVRDGRAAFVTTPDGAIVDVATEAVVCDGLGEPRAPRWHAGRLWCVDAARGTLCAVDVDAGSAAVVAELPGSACALAFHGTLAFVALAQRRGEDLPVTRRLPERRCGIWVVDLQDGAIAGFLAFTEVVHELTGLAVLPLPWPSLVLR